MTMTTPTTFAYAGFTLPPSTASRVELSRLVHEVEWIDSELTTKSVQSKAGVMSHAEPALTEQLIDFLQQNEINLLELSSRDRTLLVKQLRLLKDKAPVIHMTFASATDGESLQKLSAWARESIHPQTLITVGLQPALVAGVYVRTPNHVYDYSLRSKLEESRGVLLKELEALRG